MTDKEKLAELIYNNSPRLVEEEAKNLAKRLISYGVTVKETVDSVPVMHGHWIEQLHFNYDDEYCGSDYKCSCCGFNDVYDIEDYNYCPLCGAKMGGGIE